MLRQFVIIEETSRHYINIEETSSHYINIEETSGHYINIEETSVMFDIIEPHAFRKYSTCWVLEKSEEPCRILKKFVHACVVNAIHAKVLPGSVLYIEH